MVKLNTLSSKALRRTEKELAEVLDLAKGKLLVEVTRVKNQDLVVQLLVALKVVKCRYNKEYLSLVSLHG